MVVHRSCVPNPMGARRFAGAVPCSADKRGQRCVLITGFGRDLLTSRGFEGLYLSSLMTI